jgi:PAS domain S-box-containing protein
MASSAPVKPLARVLNVNDDEAHRYVLTRLLERADFAVIEAATSAEALQRIAVEQPDAILLDVRLPDGDGFSLCRRLKADPSTADIPVILVSAVFVRSEHAAMGVSCGADGYLTEPVDPLGLVSALKARLRVREVEAGRRVLDEQHRLLFEKNPLPGWVVDPDTLEFLAVNDAALRHSGYSRAELLAMTVADLWPVEDRPRVREHLGALAADDMTVAVWRQRTRDGQTIDVEAHGARLQYRGRDARLVLLRDITELRRAEAERAELTERERRARLAAEQALGELWLSQRRLSRLVDSKLLGIVFANRERITQANDAFLRMVGYTRDDLAATLAWHALSPIEHASRDDEAIRQLVETGECAPFETEYLRKDGTRVPVLVGAALIEADPLEWVGFVLDLTERRRAEAEREAARHDAEAASRAKDVFLALVSHDLRDPLASIVGWVRILRRQRLPEPEMQRVLERIERSTTIQTRLIEDLLDFSRIVAGKLRLAFAPVDVVHVVSEATETLRADADGRGVALRIDVRGAIPVVTADGVRVQQAVRNLVANAAKFTPSGGLVTVAIEHAAGHVRIAVTDTGVGIEPDALPRLFQLFHQAEGAAAEQHRQGLGLGLAIVRHVVEGHGGRVSAASGGKGQGATFTIELPVEPSPPAHQAPLEPRPAT